MAEREAESTEAWEVVPWGSKSFSPRRGRDGELEGGVSGGSWGMNGGGGGNWERWVMKRKSWVSSVRSVSAAGVPVGIGLSSSVSAIFEVCFTGVYVGNLHDCFHVGGGNSAGIKFSAAEGGQSLKTPGQTLE